MGLNVDLTRMLRAPTATKCPKCQSLTSTDFDDYDIQCGNPNPAPGKWCLRVYCKICDHEFLFEAAVHTHTSPENLVHKDMFQQAVEERDEARAQARMGAKLHKDLQRVLGVESHYTDEECLQEVRKLKAKVPGSSEAGTGYCLLQHYKGIPVAVEPCFPSEEYDNFTEVHAAQLEYVLSYSIRYGTVDFIEAQMDRALIHYRKGAQAHIPEFMTITVAVDWHKGRKT